MQEVLTPVVSEDSETSKGMPQVQAERLESAKRRLEAKLMAGPGGCLLFTGAKIYRGYGQILGTGKITVRAHRLSWELYRGPIPEGLCVLHKCDVRHCVNPDHLFLGTKLQNTQDMDAKGRRAIHKTQPNHRGMRHVNARFTSEQVSDIRRRSNEPRVAIAKEFGTTADYISGLVRGIKRKYDGLLDEKAGK